MYERLARLYREHKITQEALYNAVIKGWITEKQYQTIISENSNIL